jgi:hypothetical protein
VRLLCVDQESREFVQLEPGALGTYLRAEDPKMVVLRWDGREILAFVADFRDRAEVVGGAAW